MNVSSDLAVSHASGEKFLRDSLIQAKHGGRKNSLDFTAPLVDVPKPSKASGSTRAPESLIDTIPEVTEDEAYADSINLKEKMIGSMQRSSEANYKGPELPSRYEGNAKLRSRSTCEKLVSDLIHTSEGAGARVPGARPTARDACRARDEAGAATRARMGQDPLDS